MTGRASVGTVSALLTERSSTSSPRRGSVGMGRDDRPDTPVTGGWARAVWQPDQASGRGWRVPLRLPAGDVLEFAADTAETPVR
jgi:hypothetical protein